MYSRGLTRKNHKQESDFGAECGTAAAASEVPGYVIWWGPTLLAFWPVGGRHFSSSSFTVFIRSFIILSQGSLVGTFIVPRT